MAMYLPLGFLTLLFINLYLYLVNAGNHEADKYLQNQRHTRHCHQKDIQLQRRYLLYDVNWGEGFNLRRDVYVRMAVFAKHLQDAFFKCDNEEGSLQHLWIMVLPPWGPLYHWRSSELGDQFGIPWKKFFDLESLRKFVYVIEFEEYLEERFDGDSVQDTFVDQILYLQQFPFDGNWESRIKEEECQQRVKYEMDEEGRWRGFFWGYQNDFYAKNFSCLTVMGHASIMKDYLNNNDENSNDNDFPSVLLDRAETLLHDNYGDASYWSARRSMVFSAVLRAVGDRFRAEFLDSKDEDDETALDPDWKKNVRRAGSANGGPYLAIHLRRRDYVRARPKEVPSLKNAAIQAKKLLKKLNLSRVFVSSDAPEAEIQEFETLLKRKKLKNGEEEILPYSVFRFRPSEEELKEFGDGGVAIIDQWIAAHAAYFAGSHESTFSFRIQEERQILGFHPDTIFNRLCGTNKECEPPSKWLIVY